MKKLTTKSTSAIISMAIVLVYLVINFDRLWMGYLNGMKFIFN